MQPLSFSYSHTALFCRFVFIVNLVCVFVALTGGQQSAMMGVLAAGMVPASQVATLPSGVIPMGTVSPVGLSAAVPPQGMLGHSQQQGIVGAVTQPGVTQPQLGMIGTVPHTGKIGL